MDNLKLFVCNNFQSLEICSYTYEGVNDDVVSTATDHVVQLHNMEDTPQLREDIEKSLTDV